VDSDEIATRLKSELGKRGVEVIGIVHYIPQVFDACLEGRKLGDGVASEEIRKVVDALV
jgi:CO dehydrogenase nickel-insertion accessory protein CooC1